MILSVTLSKPVSDVEKKLGRKYEKIKIKIENSKGEISYFAEMFTKTQVFHRHFSETELDNFLAENACHTFKNCVKRTETEEITLMTSKKGKVTELRKKNHQNKDEPSTLKILPPKRKKNYLLEEGTIVPFLVVLGIMTPDGKVVSAKHDKFRQINRFLEFINDILPEFSDRSALSSDTRIDELHPLRIADFGCGKSYLTFAVHYFLTEIKHIPCEIEGLDLRKDVINYCNELTEKLKLKNLTFHTGNIADYFGNEPPDIVITLHACDTATDYALEYAVKRGAKAILSVPCCQHQVNKQISKPDDKAFESLLRWGIIKEKFSSLVTDALRGEWLLSKGYKVQMLEFIDMEHTPKNILIRAVKKKESGSENGTESNSKNGNKNGDTPCSVEKLKSIQKSIQKSIEDSKALIDALNINPEIWR
ncbi:SAM-dependent methyltransferase [Treponema sp. Marseille-Q3903]|uniref:class I SAM-dependent methyltransferase n=1 Tax=Treponema sp. Marseille-Q3903 TaxID=2766703 RepID=UPI001651EA9F|nr:SAM-dependent methyltransferase [Treponema sp. Marseille-Q3903]MBC6713091.1 SAM-dependent methyltransferase [Treponema sp. Marseille-Q3903]